MCLPRGFGKYFVPYEPFELLFTSIHPRIEVLQNSKLIKIPFICINFFHLILSLLLV